MSSAPETQTEKEAKTSSLSFGTVNDVVVDDVSKIDKGGSSPTSSTCYIGFGKYLSTDIFYDLGFESRNIC